MPATPPIGTPLDALAGRKRAAAERHDARAAEYRRQATELEALAASRRQADRARSK